MESGAEKRKKERRLSNFKSVYPIVLFKDPFDISDVETKKAKVVDISEEGMGLVTESPLSVGRQIEFARQHNWKLPKNAVVIWTLKQNGAFRAGIKFST